MSKFIVEMKGITKRFPGVLALNDVKLNLRAGTVHSLMGENGAGKSTLMKILAGVYTLDEGQILIDGKPVSITDPRSGLDNGIAMIHQELSFIPELSAAENIYLGRELRNRAGQVVHEKFDGGVVRAQEPALADAEAKLAVANIGGFPDSAQVLIQDLSSRCCLRAFVRGGICSSIEAGGPNHGHAEF